MNTHHPSAGDSTSIYRGGVDLKILNKIFVKTVESYKTHPKYNIMTKALNNKINLRDHLYKLLIKKPFMRQAMNWLSE
jgi:hypothetical protein